MLINSIFGWRIRGTDRLPVTLFLSRGVGSDWAQSLCSWPLQTGTYPILPVLHLGGGSLVPTEYLLNWLKTQRRTGRWSKSAPPPLPPKDWSVTLVIRMKRPGQTLGTISRWNQQNLITYWMLIMEGKESKWLPGFCMVGRWLAVPFSKLRTILGLGEF